MEREANELVQILENFGYSTYKVGGYVRDKVLGRQVQDIDLASAATPEEILKLFPKAIPTGIQHGTVTIPFNGYHFEVTTFRMDKDYTDFRHPSQVQFVRTIEEDLARRDFTMNAMAMDLSGRIIDPFEGQRDLMRGQIRAVGDPYKRMREDALRILRGIRFAAQLNFILEDVTWLAMIDSSLSLLQISKERIREEWRKTIESDFPLQGIKLLSYPNLIPFQEWKKLFYLLQQNEGIVYLHKEKEIASRWAFVFACGGKKNASTLLADWKFPKKLIQEIQSILAFVFEPLDTEVEIKRAIVSLGLKKLENVIKIKNALKFNTQFKVEELHLLNQQIQIRSLDELAIKGSDLIQRLDRKPGPWVGKCLLQLFEKVAYHGVPNEFFTLLKEVREGNEDEKKDS